jgi:MFS family permease
MIRLLTGLAVLAAGAATLVMGGARIRSERTLEHETALARWEDDGYVDREVWTKAGEAGLIVAAFGLGALAYTQIARRMVRRFGERGLLFWGGLGLAGGLALTALAPNWGVVLALQLVLGFGFYSFHGVLQARATEAMPEARGTAVSAFAMALFMGQTSGSLIFAGVIAAGGYAWAFGIAAAGMAVFAVWVRGGVSRGSSA